MGSEEPPADLRHRYDIIKPVYGETVHEKLKLRQIPYIDDSTTKAWLPTWLNNGGADYLRTNPTTVEGMKSVATFNGLGDIWDKYVAEHGDATTRTKYHKLIELFIKSDKRNGNNHFFGAEEGRHRSASEVLTLLGANYDETTATFKFNTLEYKHLQYLNTDMTLQGDILAETLDPILEGTKSTKMLTQRFVLKVVYFTDSTADVKSGNQVLIKESEKIARKKTESSLPKFCATVARIIKGCIPGSSTDRNVRPDLASDNSMDLRNIPYKGPKFDFDSSEAGGVETDLYADHKFMAWAEFKNYVGNPFNLQVEQDLRAKFTCSAVESKPPSNDSTGNDNRYVTANKSRKYLKILDFLYFAYNTEPQQSHFYFLSYTGR